MILIPTYYLYVSQWSYSTFPLFSPFSHLFSCICSTLSVYNVYMSSYVSLTHDPTVTLFSALLSNMWNALCWSFCSQRSLLVQWNSPSSKLLSKGTCTLFLEFWWVWNWFSVTLKLEEQLVSPWVSWKWCSSVSLLCMLFLRNLGPI